jgi:hypothetical protein
LHADKLQKFSNDVVPLSNSPPTPDRETGEVVLRVISIIDTSGLVRKADAENFEVNPDRPPIVPVRLRALNFCEHIYSPSIRYNLEQIS